MLKLKDVKYIYNDFVGVQLFIDGEALEWPLDQVPDEYLEYYVIGINEFEEGFDIEKEVK